MSNTERTRAPIFSTFSPALSLNIDLGINYKSRTQQARRLTEDWVARYGYCLKCDSDQLAPTQANTRTRDFECVHCSHGYELKSKCGSFSDKILDGAYSAMIATIREGKTPTFLLLEYSSSWIILGLRAIHHSLITEHSIKARKPLSASARRAGWTGCNIELPSIAVQGQIQLLGRESVFSKDVSRKAFAKLENLASLSSTNRTWAATILGCVDKLAGDRFSLSDLYDFEPELRKLFPANQNIKPKIRQQLQFLRNSGLILFHGGAVYERVRLNSER